MTHLVCCSIWHSSWHFNRLFQWLYLYIRYSHHTYTLSFLLKRLPVSDLVRSTAETDIFNPYKERWLDGAISDCLKLPLSNFLFGLIIDNSASSIKLLFQFDAISKSVNSSPLFHSDKWQNISKPFNRIHLLDLPNYTHLFCSRQLVECAQ